MSGDIVAHWRLAFSAEWFPPTSLHSAVFASLDIARQFDATATAIFHVAYLTPASVRHAAWSLCAASTSVADIVRIAEPVARASTTDGVLHQDDAPQPMRQDELSNR